MASANHTNHNGYILLKLIELYFDSYGEIMHFCVSLATTILACEYSGNEYDVHLMKMEQMRNELMGKLHAGLQEAIGNNRDQKVTEMAKLISDLEKHEVVRIGFDFESR